MPALLERTEIDRGATISDDRAWTAVVQRDRALDGRFVYAVRTTRVYCRPTCPSRRPQRRNVSFFTNPSAAESAGYRPCRRCRPNAREGTPTERSIDAARAYLDALPTERVPLERLARAVGLSPTYLQRAFTRLIGVSPKVYHDAQRRNALRAHLRRGETVTRATYAAGFGSPSSAYRATGSGVAPGAYRRGGQGLAVRYGIAECSLGRLLVAATTSGVCAVMLGDDDRELERELANELPLAATERDDRGMAEWAGAVVRQVDTGARCDVPLDLRGSTFQLRVWRALQQIPRGETRSYAEVAASIGRPTAARAVARACATNPVAIVVPCHRVVAASGAPAGYRWGIDRKTRLLRKEIGR